MEWLIQVAGLLVGGGALYGAIRQDLKNQRASLARAHKRIDDHMDWHLAK